jgi:hypothetical protein
MHQLLKEMDSTKKLNSLFPWENFSNQDNLEFRNLLHFTHIVGKLRQRKDNHCNISYQKAFKELKLRVPRIAASEQESIRNLVRSKLHKRGLITEEVYESFVYATNGTQVGVDVGKYAAGEPDCVITPGRQYVDFFYELFINISYPYDVENSTVMANVAKLLSAIEELERKHIFIKITLVFPCDTPAEDRNLFLSIPLFSHKDRKTVEIMSAVVNDRLLRKFVFAVMEDFYGTELISNYGTAVTLDNVMAIGSSFDEIAFFEEVVNTVGA